MVSQGYRLHPFQRSCQPHHKRYLSSSSIRAHISVFSNKFCAFLCSPSSPKLPSILTSHILQSDAWKLHLFQFLLLNIGCAERSSIRQARVSFVEPLQKIRDFCCTHPLPQLTHPFLQQLPESWDLCAAIFTTESPDLFSVWRSALKKQSTVWQSWLRQTLDGFRGPWATELQSMIWDIGCPVPCTA